MDIELTLFVILPIIIAFVEIIYSAIKFIKSVKLTDYINPSVIIIFNSIAVYILIQIIYGAYPSYIPHLLIIISTILLLLKSRIIRKRLPTTVIANRRQR
jgi:hypothetical protein